MILIFNLQSFRFLDYFKWTFGRGLITSYRRLTFTVDTCASIGLFLGTCKMKKLPKCCFRMSLTLHLCILLMLCISQQHFGVFSYMSVQFLCISTHMEYEKKTTLKWGYLSVRCSGVWQGSGASSQVFSFTALSPWPCLRKR